METAAMKALVMEQLQEDVDDLAERDALITAYIGDGYLELMTVRKRGKTGPIPSFAEGNELPEQFHMALVDYATYRVLSIGNSQKQQRGQFFLSRFISAKSTMKSEIDEEAEAANGGKWKFNIY